MVKKIFYSLLFASLVVIVQSFVSATFQAPKDELTGPVKWYTFSEAVALQKIKPKPIMVDVYTSWCGPCRMMSANTFGNTTIANYLNENYYPVKFNAETFDTVSFNGFVFVNKNPKGTQRAAHDFAISILDGKLMYPSIVFINEEIKRIYTSTGYLTPVQFEPIMKYIGSGKYKTTSWDEFQKGFSTEIK